MNIKNKVVTVLALAVFVLPGVSFAASITGTQSAASLKAEIAALLAEVQQLEAQLSAQGQMMTTGTAAPSLAVSIDPSTPSVGTVVMNTTGNTLGVFRFSNPQSTEAIKVTSLILTNTVSAPAITPLASFSNVGLWNGSTELGIAAAPVLVGSSKAGAAVYSYTFNFATPVIIPAGSSIALTVKGDAGSYTNGGVTDDSINQFSIASNNAVIAFGATSNASAVVTVTNAVAYPQTLLRTVLNVIGQSVSTMPPSSFQKIGSVTLTANAAGDVVVKSLKLTFGGNSYNSAFLNSVELRDPSGNDIVSVDQFAEVGITSNGIAWIFDSTSHSLIISAGSSYTMTLWGDLSKLSVVANQVQSITATIQSTGDVSYYDGTNSSAILVNLSANQVPITVVNLSGSTSSVPRPTVRLSTTATTIAVNALTNITWSATNATACTPSGFGSSLFPATAGTVSFVANTPGTYTLSVTCTGPGGTSAPASVTITVTGATTVVPTATISATPTTVTANPSSGAQPITLTWSSTNATACAIWGTNGYNDNGAWGKDGLAPSGSMAVGPYALATSSYTALYRIYCTGPGGTSQTASATVTVNPAPASTPLLSIASVSGLQSSYQVGQSISFTLNGVQLPSDKPADSSDGFNVQASLSANGGLSNINGVNGAYNSATGLWNVTLLAPSTPGTYALSVALYCANTNASCYAQYANAATQVSKSFTLTISPTVTPTQQVPVITTISPNQGTGNNTAVTIYGTNLTGATAVDFYNSSNQEVASAAQFSVASNGQSLSLVLGGAFSGMVGVGTYQVKVVTPGGTSNGLNFTLIPQAAPAAQLSISPSSITIGSGNPMATVTVTNAGASGSTLNWVLAGTPGGISASPQSGTLGAGASQQVTFTYSSSATPTGSTPEGLYFYPVSAISSTGNNGTPAILSVTVTSPQPVQPTYNGTVNVTLDPSTPTNTGTITAGQKGVAFAKMDIGATGGSINLQSLSVVTNNAATMSALSNIKIYNGSTLLGSVAGLTPNPSVSGSSVNIFLSPSLALASGQSVALTIVADVASTASGSFTVGIGGGGGYYSTWNTSGSVYGNSLTVAAAASAAPSISQVQGLTATATGGSVALSWSRASASAGVGVYDIYRSTSSGFTPNLWNMIVQTGGNSYTDSGLTVGAYYYAVAAQDINGVIGTPSAQASVIVTSAQSSAADNSNQTAIIAQSLQNALSQLEALLKSLQ